MPIRAAPPLRADLSWSAGPSGPPGIRSIVGADAAIPDGLPAIRGIPAARRPDGAPPGRAAGPPWSWRNVLPDPARPAPLV